MITRWEQGRTTIDTLLADRRLERVAPSRELADALVDQAERHLATAAGNVQADPPGVSSWPTTPPARPSPQSSPTKDCARGAKEPTPSC